MQLRKGSVKSFGRCLVGLTTVLAASALAIDRRDDVDDSKYLELAQESQFSMVGRLAVKVNGGTKFGTGIFIGIGNKMAWIVTATHVLTGFQEGSKFNIGGKSYELGARFEAMDDQDMAVVPILGYKDGDLTAAKFSNTVVEIHRTLSKRTTAYMVGYGNSGTGSNPGTVDDDRKRACTNIIDAYNLKRQKGFVRGQPDYQVYPGYLTDFDNGKAVDNTLDKGDNDAYRLQGAQYSSPTQTALEGGTEDGDSGGPLFIRVGSQWILVGVISGTFKGGDSFKTSTGYGSWTNFVAIDQGGAKFIKTNTGIDPVAVVSP